MGCARYGGWGARGVETQIAFFDSDCSGFYCEGPDLRPEFWDEAREGVEG